MEDLKEVQHAVLGIMKDIDKICTENHIKYWLYAGTLIGAVRHNGFIPWDESGRGHAERRLRAFFESGSSMLGKMLFYTDLGK